MTAIGETLRRERQRRNIDLQQISRELKISVRFLEAIEEEQFSKLPGAVFAKSFVRQYARLLGLDEEEMVAEVARLVEPPPEVPPIQAKTLPPIAGIPKLATSWERIGDSDRAEWLSWAPRLGLLVVLTLACSGVYALWQRTRVPAPAGAEQEVKPSRPVDIAQSPAAAPQTVPEPAQVASNPPAAPAPSQSADRSVAEPSPAQPAAPPAQSPAGTEAGGPKAPVQSAAASAAEAGSPVHVELTAQEPVWVRVRVNGKYLFSGTLEANQSRTMDTNGAVELLLGNAGGIEISLNGKPIGAIGPKGQVRTVQLSSGGFKIVSSPKPGLPAFDPL